MLAATLAPNASCNDGLLLALLHEGLETAAQLLTRLLSIVLSCHRFMLRRIDHGDGDAGDGDDVEDDEADAGGHSASLAQLPLL